ncbi:hypothetical protein Godav_012068, partial [Gossypium davidsonii]|nr:hypothetical protein [Gossypium davidsonii]
MSGESPKQPPKRGRPSWHLPTDNPKKSKRITDQKARQENRAIVVELTEAAPRLTQLLESVRSINGGDLQQTLRYIQDIVVELKKAAPILKQFLEAFGSSIKEGDLLQTLTCIR